MPISYYCVGIMLQFIFLAGVRFSYRLVLLLRSQQKIARSNESRVMVIGAGNPFNSRLDKSKLREAGFTPLPDWKDALARYLEILNK